MFGTMHGFLRGMALASLALGAAACTQTKSYVHDQVPARPAGGVEVLLLEPDIELSELSVGGIAFPKADWTERGRSNVNAALVQIMERKNARLIFYEGPADAPPEHPYNQVLKLHEAVGNEILNHKYSNNALLTLPTKRERFDWTLGPEVQQLREVYDADYALFIYFRDSFATGGRIAMMVVVGALTGMVVPGGSQVGYASLVDLDSGDILWFNVLFSQGGDLRDAADAAEATEDLLDQLPL